VLPYVYQGGVEHYGWLTGPQMIDGLALGETTPGPLIMVVAFVGFVGGWTKQISAPTPCSWPDSPPRRSPPSSPSCPPSSSSWWAGRSSNRTHGDIKFTAPAHRHNRRRGGRDRESGGVSRLACVVAAGSAAAPFAGAFEWFSALLTVAALRRLFPSSSGSCR